MKFSSKLPLYLTPLLLPAAGLASVEHTVSADMQATTPATAPVAAVSDTATPVLPVAAVIERSPPTEVPAVPVRISEEQAICMTKVIVHEAGNQPRRGQQAVAQVIRNRIRDGLVYLQVTRGRAPRDHAFPNPPVRPTVVVTAKRVDLAAAQARAERGVAVITTPEPRWARCDIKTVGLSTATAGSRRAPAPTPGSSPARACW